eukprot:TRINITY_DN6355_c0_g1_i1.p1 TRINITY_DN6355_c0_g1~~TRINITY_DN6355_c0_g1_i1.p1  ORF type:complete len:260 (+),score=17.63 TRINITY_DN6355_c0_g1_i1:71-781(+)
MAPHFVLALSAFYAAAALRRNTDDRVSDMQMRSTGTINASEVALDQSLVRKGSSEGHDGACAKNNEKCRGAWHGKPWIPFMSLPTTCCDPSMRCIQGPSNSPSARCEHFEAKPGESYDDRCAALGAMCGTGSSTYVGPTCCQNGQKCVKSESGSIFVCEDDNISAKPGETYNNLSGKTSNTLTSTCAKHSEECRGAWQHGESWIAQKSLPTTCCDPRHRCIQGSSFFSPARCNFLC